MSTSKLLGERTPSEAPALDAVTLLWVNTRPLANRLRRGEGLLLLVNLSIGLFGGTDGATFLAGAFLSTVVLALLYCLNDVYDCRRDLNDGAKDQTLARFCVRHREQILWTLKVEKVVTVLAALALAGPRSAMAVAAVFLVNIAYSAALKGKAGLDVLWVGLWGSLYARVPGVPLTLSVVALVGVMTSICHIFQIIRDRDADGLNHLRTSAVALSWLPVAQLTLACTVMGILLGYHLGPLGGASAAAPLLFRLAMKSNQKAWLVSKAYYGVVWLLVLGSAHGS